MKSKIARLLESKNIKNSGWIIGEQVFRMLIQLVVGVITARYLGPSNYGSLNYTASFVTFFTSIATLGMDGVIIKKLIEHPDEEGAYIGSCMGLRLIASFLSILSVSVIVYILNPSDYIKLVLVFLQSFQLSFKAIEILDSWFQRYLKSKYVSVGKMIACIVVSAYKIFLLATSKSIIWFALSSSLMEAVIAFVEWVFYKREGGRKLSFSFSIGKQVLSESYHFILSGLMVAIYSQMDKIMIGQMLTDTDVGYYTTATAICGMWIFVPTAIINSFNPMIMELKKNGNERIYLRRLQQLYSFVIWLCLGFSLVIAVLAKIIVLVLYGSSYLGAVGALRITIWCETFAMIGTLRGIWIICENKNKYVKYYVAIGAIVNLVLNAIMIPRIGINGAAIATLITQITTSLIAPLFFKETKVHTSIVLRSFVCSWYFEGKKDRR